MPSAWLQSLVCRIWNGFQPPPPHSQETNPDTPTQCRIDYTHTELSSFISGQDNSMTTPNILILLLHKPLDTHNCKDVLKKTLLYFLQFLLQCTRAFIHLASKLGLGNSICWHSVWFAVVSRVWWLFSCSWWFGLWGVTCSLPCTSSCVCLYRLRGISQGSTRHCGSHIRNCIDHLCAMSDWHGSNCRLILKIGCALIHVFFDNFQFD